MMNTSASPKSFRRAAAAAALVVGLALTGCQTAAVSDDGPKPAVKPVREAPQAPAGVDTTKQADRMAEQIERNHDRMREMSQRFAGVPADRIVEQLERERAAAEVAH
jgi:hypothetical protein